MKRIVFTAVFLALVFGQSPKAQVPATVHATWTPNAATDNVIQYTIILDTAAPVVLPASACTVGLCSQALTVPTFGVHNVVLTAQNQGLSGLQSSLPSTISFTLAAAPTVVAGLKITN
jgi:hypothetical protein